MMLSYTPCPVYLRAMAKLRIRADFNNGNLIWILWHGDRPLQEQAQQLGLFAGMPVTLVDLDKEEEFEFDGVLEHNGSRWLARVIEGSYRRIPRA